MWTKGGSELLRVVVERRMLRRTDVADRSCAMARGNRHQHPGPLAQEGAKGEPTVRHTFCILAVPYTARPK